MWWVCKAFSGFVGLSKTVGVQGGIYAVRRLIVKTNADGDPAADGIEKFQKQLVAAMWSVE